MGCGRVEFVNHFRDRPDREKLLEARARAFGKRFIFHSHLRQHVAKKILLKEPFSTKIEKRYWKQNKNKLHRKNMKSKTKLRGLFHGCYIG